MCNSSQGNCDLITDPIYVKSKIISEINIDLLGRLSNKAIQLAKYSQQSSYMWMLNSIIPLQS